MIAAIPSAVLTGVDGTPVSVEVHVSNGLPGFTVVGSARCRCPRISGPGAGRACCPAASTGRCAGSPSTSPPPGCAREGRGSTCPSPSGCWWPRAHSSPKTSTGWPSSVSSASTAPSGVCRGRWCWPRRWPPSGWSCPRRARWRRSSPGSPTCARRRRSARWWTGSPARADGPTAGPITGPSGQPAPSSPGAADLSAVRGQRMARRALEVAAAGGHHLLFVGPPGSGKTMLATCLPGLLPDVDRATALEVTRVALRGRTAPSPGRPGRAASLPGPPPRRLVGGDDRGRHRLDAPGRDQPGPRRGPLPRRDGRVPVGGARRSAPTPRGRSGPRQSGPGLDGVPRPFHPRRGHEPVPLRRGREAGSMPVHHCRPGAVRQTAVGAPARPLRHRRAGRPARVRGPARPARGRGLSRRWPARVALARSLARARGVTVNAELPGGRLDELAPLDRAASRLVEHHVRSGALSARGLHRVRRLARTVADLDGGGDLVEESHIRLALHLRCHRELLLGADR